MKGKASLRPAEKTLRVPALSEAKQMARALENTNRNASAQGQGLEVSSDEGKPEGSSNNIKYLPSSERLWSKALHVDGVVDCATATEVVENQVKDV